MQGHLTSEDRTLNDAFVPPKVSLWVVFCLNMVRTPFRQPEFPVRLEAPLASCATSRYGCDLGRLHDLEDSGFSKKEEMEEKMDGD